MVNVGKRHDRMRRPTHRELLLRIETAAVVGKGRGIFGLYPATDPQTLTDFAEWRKKNGR